MNLKSLGILLLVFFSMNMVFSSEYADISLLIDERGDVLISGIDSSSTLLRGEKTPQYTSKEGKYWTINFSSETIYETFIFETTFPKGAQINYIKTTPNFRIDEDQGNLKIIGTGANKPITLIVQYEIDNELEKDYFQYFFIVLLLILGMIFGYVVSTNYRRKKVKSFVKEEYEHLNERQKEILSILQLGKITQKKLEETMQIPKASISRNVKTLCIKGYIQKEQVGNTNYLSIKKRD